MANIDHSLSLATPDSRHLDTIQKLGLTVAALGVLLLIAAGGGAQFPLIPLFFGLSLLLIFAGAIIYATRTYLTLPEGIKNNAVWFRSLTNRGVWGWLFGIIITGFYILLYWYPQYLGLGKDGAANTGFIQFFDPLSQFLKKQPASQWFAYGTLYTVAILAMGFKFILKYRHNRYQLLRTISVMFFQLGFAFLLPEFFQSMDKPYFDFKNMWPLNYYFFYDWNITGLLKNGNIGLLMLGFGVAMVFLISPVLTYLYGKRWYCSWVCGCGGLAETAGDPYRHLSDKSLNAWKIERWVIHSVLVFVTIMTIATLHSFFNANGGYWINKNIFVIGVSTILLTLAGLAYFKRNIVNLWSTTTRLSIAGVLLAILLLTLIAYFTGSSRAFFVETYQLQKWYGFLIGSAFSGVVGVGFYPIMGSRVWCRFGCPMAAILGIQQKFFSRFRITVNGGQCISCGNCSAYCEMGIDVRAYAQKGQDIVRASCVGCGICAAVCPRGVLKLENGTSDIQERTTHLRTIHVTEDQVMILQ